MYMVDENYAVNFVQSVCEQEHMQIQKQLLQVVRVHAWSSVSGSGVPLL